MSDVHAIRLIVNGVAHDVEVEARRTLADVLRHDLGLTGTHLGCEHGICGACTVLVEGQAARSCLLFGVQVDGAEIETVEGLAGPGGELDDVQQAFSRHHGLQCGFCTPGFLMLATEYLRGPASAEEDDVRELVSANLCRCTGYEGIVDAIQDVAARRAEGADGERVSDR